MLALKIVFTNKNFIKSHHEKRPITKERIVMHMHLKTMLKSVLHSAYYILTGVKSCFKLHLILKHYESAFF